MTISPVLRQLRRVMTAFGVVTPERGELAKVIPIAPYLKSRPTIARANRAPVRIIEMPRTSNRGR